MYGTPGSTTYEATHENKNDSTVKIAVDKWYEDNLKTNYANYLADTLFCEDKTLASDGYNGVTKQLGYGTNKTFYSVTERFDSRIATTMPVLKCAEKANDNYSRYTTTKSTLPNGKETNGDLKYPIGLLSADEIVYAGAYKFNTVNKTCYLYDGSPVWYLFAPNYYDGSKAYVWNVAGTNGYIYYMYDVSNFYNFRPTINLKKDVKFSGTGISGDPYKIVTE